MRPAHPGVERLAADEHLGHAVGERREGEELAHGRQPGTLCDRARTFRSDRLIFATICHRFTHFGSATLGNTSLAELRAFCPAGPFHP
ncbi:hypothetical protein Agsp01_34280 [Agromyces sp. NBRC 114283]|nr:hypothetical protein Agsp01_34280 [Agromyces sp. NBRC 114283]